MPAAPGLAPLTVVLTGGPGSGKTTLLEYFRALGYAVVPEAALQVIQELAGELGLEAQRVWRQRHVRQFQERILARQVQSESAIGATPSRWVFLDRGRIDGLAYFRLSRVRVPPGVRRTMLAARYRRVFVLDTLPGYDARPETGRAAESYADSIRIQRALVAAYRDAGYEPLALPAMSVEARAAWVLQRLGPDAR